MIVSKEGSVMLMLFLVLSEESSKFFAEFFKELYEPNNKRLQGYACHILCDTLLAEDAVQQSFLKLFPYEKKLRALNERQQMAYVYKALYSSCMDTLRKSGREPVVKEPEDDCEPIKPNGYYLVVDNSGDKEFAAEILKRLKPNYAEVLMLRYFYDQSSAQIAKHMNINVGYVDTLLCRAKNKADKIAKEMMENEGY